MDRQTLGLLLIALVAIDHINHCDAQRRRRQTSGLGRILGAAASVALAGAAAHAVTGLITGRRRRQRRQRRRRPIYRDNYAYDNVYGRDAYGRGVYSGDLYGNDVYSGDLYGSRVGDVYERRRIADDVYSGQVPVYSGGHGATVLGHGLDHGLSHGLSHGSTVQGHALDHGLGHGLGHGSTVQGHGHGSVVYPVAGTVGTRRRVTEYESTYSSPIVSSGLGTRQYII